MGLFSGRKRKVSEPTFAEPNQAEIDWMAAHLAFADEMDVDVEAIDQVASFYAMLLQSWVGSPPDSRSDPNGSINILGTLFGEHLVRKTPMQWVVATDPHGVELAVHDRRTDMLVYPANAVAKRWVNGESGEFMRAMTHDIVTRTGGR